MSDYDIKYDVFIAFHSWKFSDKKSAQHWSNLCDWSWHKDAGVAWLRISKGTLGPLELPSERNWVCVLHKHSFPAEPISISDGERANNFTSNINSISVGSIKWPKWQIARAADQPAEDKLQKVNYQKAGALSLSRRPPAVNVVSITQRYIIGPYIASIITPRAVLIGGEAILKCHPITHIAIGTSSYFYLRPMCSNKRVSESTRAHLARNQSYTRRAVYARARPSRNIYIYATSRGNSFVPLCGSCWSASY